MPLSLLVCATELLILWIIPRITHKWSQIHRARCWADTNLYSHICWKQALLVQTKDQFSLLALKSNSFKDCFSVSKDGIGFTLLFLQSERNMYFQRAFQASCINSCFVSVPHLASTVLYYKFGQKSKGFHYNALVT